jgi:FlaA1/EpsC-like NDP-sugar epimerase
VDIEIKFIGFRPGEKLYEELITEGEGIVRTPYDKIFVLKGESCDLHWLNKKIEEPLNWPMRRIPMASNQNLKKSSPNTNPLT